MIGKLLRHGNSQAVIIPSKFLKKLSIKRGGRVELHFEDQAAKIVLTFPEAQQLSLETLRSRARPKKR